MFQQIIYNIFIPNFCLTAIQWLIPQPSKPYENTFRTLILRPYYFTLTLSLLKEFHTNPLSLQGVVREIWKIPDEKKGNFLNGQWQTIKGRGNLRRNTESFNTQSVSGDPERNSQGWKQAMEFSNQQANSKYLIYC